MVGEDVGDLRERQTLLRQLVGVDVDAHLVRDGAGDGDGTDVVDLLQGGHEDGLDLVRQRGEVVPAGRGDLDDGEVVEGAGDDLRLDVVGELSLDARHRGGEALGGGVHVGAVGELDHGGRHPGGRGRADGLDALDALGGGLEGLGDVLLDDLGDAPG